MRILAINTVYEKGSTGRTLMQIAEKIEQNRDEYFACYGQGKVSNKNTLKIGTVLENHLHNLGSRLIGKQGYFTKKGTLKLVKFIEEYEPDIIHLHNLHGNYLNLEIFFSFLKIYNKPVVWTLHDCWAFTGKCAHYTNVACFKWQTACHHCPQIRTYPPSMFLDQTEIMFEDKKKWFTTLSNLTLLPVSNWLAEEVKKSFFKDFPIIPIYNWVNHAVFKDIGEDVRLKYGIPLDKFIVLGVSAGWDDSTTRFKDFMALSKMLLPNMQLVMVGEISRGTIIPSSIIHIPYVHGEAELAKLYSNANVYVHLSTEDTFGKVIAEAMSCGTPVIVYNSTACPEIVGDGCGYIVEKNNVNKIYEKIQIINENGKDKYSFACRNHVVKFFDMDNNIKKIIEIYKDIII
jgi:putative colanic acid biosynthesis glycosyltransferase